MSKLSDVKASGNWMYAAKMAGEGAAMYDAAVALRDAMIELRVAIDGGKDSLSMAAKVSSELELQRPALSCCISWSRSGITPCLTRMATLCLFTF